MRWKGHNYCRKGMRVRGKYCKCGGKLYVSRLEKRIFCSKCNTYLTKWKYKEQKQPVKNESKVKIAMGVVRT